MTRPRWRSSAACRGTDPGVFYVDPGGDLAPAKAICATCPVRAECYEDGLPEHHGVWGGAGESERRKERRRRRAAEAAGEEVNRR